jgi:metallo-beta-lactamase family protein
MASLSFLGATGTVTGSRYLLEIDHQNFLIDCGMFQGLKELRLRNWDKFPVPPQEISAVILTHAHIDHSGYLPRLVKMGFQGPVYTTTATAELCEIMLLDSAHLQEEDARYANKKKFSKHDPALPLYDQDDARAALALLNPYPYGVELPLTKNAYMEFRDAGHILGSAFVSIHLTLKGEKRRILFSGDLGRPNQPILRDPHTIYDADYMIVESTYGDRLHGQEDIQATLARVVNDSIARGGVLIVPSFAVGRTQELLYTLRELEEKGSIPALPVFVDSPMAISVTEIFKKNSKDHDLTAKVLESSGKDILQTAHLEFCRERQRSQAINDIKDHAIIISASGMVTGGRIVHHLFHRLPNPKNTVLFIGYQAVGTRGRTILDGAEKVKMLGQHVTIKAHVENISGFSAHADYQEELAWLSTLNQPPRNVFIVHGEPEQSRAMAGRIRESYNWPVEIPEYLSKYELE